MFTTPTLVLKDGRVIVRDGRVVETVIGATHVVHPEHDAAIERDVDDYFDRYMTVRKDSLMVDDDEIRDEGRGALVVHATTPA